MAHKVDAATTKLRAKMRAGRIDPMPKGVVVTGRLSGWEAPRAQCAGHVFLTRAPIRNVEWQSGWQQAAFCLVCEEDLPAIDASWWIEEATLSRFQVAMRLAEEESKRLRRAWKNLKERSADAPE